MDVCLLRVVDFVVMVIMWLLISFSYVDERELCVFLVWRMRVSRVSLWFLRRFCRVCKFSLYRVLLILLRFLSLDINFIVRFCIIFMSLMVFLREGFYIESVYFNIGRHKLVL